MADIIVFLIIALFVLFGFKKGFVGTVFGIASLAATFVLARALYPAAAEIIEAFGVKIMLTERIAAGMSGYSGEGIEALPEMLREAIESGQMQMINAAAESAAGIVLNIISFIAVCIASRILIWIAAGLLGVAAKLPVIKTFNRLLGMLVGAVQGIAVVYIVLAIFLVAVPVGADNKISHMIEESRVAVGMYENNPIVNIFTTDDAADDSAGQDDAVEGNGE